MDTLNEHIKNLKQLIDESEQKASRGSFAYELQTSSLNSHLQELKQKKMLLPLYEITEMIDFRMIAESMKAGTISLALLAKISNSINKMFGHVADHIARGEKATSRVPSEIYRALNLQLIGLQPGSTRLLISANANRDLFDEGLAKNTMNRVLNLLETYGEGEDFLESIMDLGSHGSRNLRDLLQIINSLSGALEINWKHNGRSERIWKGSNSQIVKITSALESMIVKEPANETVAGIIELLSKRERIHLRKENGELIKILFSNAHLEEVEHLHLNQQVKLLCKISETEIPHTGENFLYHELVEIIEE